MELIEGLKLNPNQAAAARWDNGPILVLAGPGSGKTSVLAYRIVRLIAESPESRFRVVGLTFTNKAASEMRDRVAGLLNHGSERALLTTFHSFAADVLRQHGSHIGIAPDFTILNTDEDRSEFFADAVTAASRLHSDIEETDRALLPLLTNLVEKRVSEAGVHDRIRDPQLGKKLSILYAAYLKELLDNNALDFPFLIVMATKLLQEHENIARLFRVIYPHICVDEFQDTNVAQFDFLRAFVGTDANGLFVVADDDQIVYQWNGASPERLTELKQAFGMTTIELPENYRCPKPIIDVANRLISHNPNRTKTKMTLQASPNKENPTPIRVKCLGSPDLEAQWVASDIAKLPKHKREFCVVLARTKNLVERVAQSLQQADVPCTLSVKKNEFISAPLRWLHAMLRLANSRGDKEQVRRACKAFYDLEGVQIVAKDVIAAASAIGGDCFRAWLQEALARRSALDPECLALLTRFGTELADRMEYAGFVRQAFDWFQFLLLGQTTLNGAEGFSDYEEEHQVWDELCQAINARYGVDAASLNMLLQEMDLMPKQPPAPADAVRCYTIHTAKGMEFDHVYLIGMAEDILPSYQSTRKGDSSVELQEERRSCFVAITRTRECLTLTRSENYFGYSKSPSRFLREMGLTSG